MNVKGQFEVSMKAEPPYDTRDGVTLARITLDKKFSGALEATSVGQMTAARTPVAESAGYVAIERVEGTLHGKRGSFILQHTGVSTRGMQSLSVTVVHDSATGELTGLTGSMKIDMVEGKHFYDFEYLLPSPTG